MIITVAETVMIALAGEGARMKDAPRMLISQSLPQVIANATPEVAQQVTNFLYPGMLGVGVLAYGLDVARAFQAQQTADREAKAKQSAVLVRAANLPVETQQAGPQAAPEAAPSVPDLVIAAGGGNGAGMDELASHDGREFISPRGF